MVQPFEPERQKYRPKHFRQISERPVYLTDVETLYPGWYLLRPVFYLCYILILFDLASHFPTKPDIFKPDINIVDFVRVIKKQTGLI